MTARGSGLRIWWDCHRGCCEAGPPPSMPRCRVSIHENLERILWLRKRRRRRRPRRRRPRSRRRSEFWPGWSAQLRPGSQLRVRFGEWRALGSAFLFPAIARRCSPDERSDIRDHSRTAPGYRFAHPGYDLHMDCSGYRSANASLAPSAAKPAAKLRRSQAIAFGRVMTRSRREAANRP